MNAKGKKEAGRSIGCVYGDMVLFYVEGPETLLLDTRGCV